MTANNYEEIKLWSDPLWKTIYNFLGTLKQILDDCDGDLQNEKYLQTKEAMRTFLLSLEFLLPCGKCRDHYASFVVSHPLHSDGAAFKSIGSIERWIAQLKADIKKNQQQQKAPTAVVKKPAPVAKTTAFAAHHQRKRGRDFSSSLKTNRTSGLIMSNKLGPNNK